MKWWCCLALVVFGRVGAEPSKRLTLDDMRTFTQVLGHVQQQYIDQTTDHELLENAIRGMLSGLDAHTQYLTPAQYQTLTADSQAHYGGVGIELLWQEARQSTPAGLRIIGVRNDSPAALAGLQTDDLIVAVDGRSLAGLTPARSMELTRGPIDSAVDFSIRRGERTLAFAMKREQIRIESVAAELLSNRVGKLQVTGFNADTAASASRLLQRLTEQASGPLGGLILDLRGNVGGVVVAAVALADLFLDDGLIVYSEGRIEQAEFRHEASAGDLLNGAPMVVLVDRMSASASEIVAGALQDLGRATVIGERTFGKGSIQTVLPLANGGGIKLTTSKYFTPGGRSISGAGISPDIPVGAGENGDDPGLKAALELLTP